MHAFQTGIFISFNRSFMRTILYFIVNLPSFPQELPLFGTFPLYAHVPFFIFLLPSYYYSCVCSFHLLRPCFSFSRYPMYDTHLAHGIHHPCSSQYILDCPLYCKVIVEAFLSTVGSVTKQTENNLNFTVILYIYIYMLLIVL